MDLLIIRHAIAEDRDEFAATGRSDTERPLTSEGRRKMKRASPALRALVPHLDLIAASPWARARQTAEIVAAEYGNAAITTFSELEGDANVSALADRLASLDGGAVIAVVGHDPHLRKAISWFIGGGEEAQVELKKGGACLLHFPKKVGAGRAALRWLLTPRQLRSLA